MHRLLNFPFESSEVVEFAEILDAPPSAPILVLLKLLFDAIGENGLKATATGNLPRNTCRQISHAYMGDELYSQRTAYGQIMSETDILDLNIARLLAQEAGLIRYHAKHFKLTRKARSLSAATGFREMYPLLFREAVSTYNWGYADRFCDMPTIQYAWAFSLFLLWEHGHEEQEQTYYEDRFFRAFPMLVDEAQEAVYMSRFHYARLAYSYRTFKHSFHLLGLVELVENQKETHPRKFSTRATELLHSFVTFHTK